MSLLLVPSLYPIHHYHLKHDDGDGYSDYDDNNNDQFVMRIVMVMVIMMMRMVW